MEALGWVGVVRFAVGALGVVEILVGASLVFEVSNINGSELRAAVVSDVFVEVVVLTEELAGGGDLDGAAGEEEGAEDEVGHAQTFHVGEEGEEEHDDQSDSDCLDNGECPLLDVEFGGEDGGLEVL